MKRCAYVRSLPKDIICLYDSAALTDPNASPLMAWQDHSELVVAFSLHPSNPNVFFSGSQDKTIRFCGCQAYLISLIPSSPAPSPSP